MKKIIRVIVAGLGCMALGYHSGHAGKDGYKSVPEGDNPERQIITAQMKPDPLFRAVERLKKTLSSEAFKALAEAAAKNQEEDAARGPQYRAEIEKWQEQFEVEKKSEMERRAILEEMARSKREREQGNHTPTATVR